MGTPEGAQPRVPGGRLKWGSLKRLRAGPSARHAISALRSVGQTSSRARPDSFKQPRPSLSTSANSASLAGHRTRLLLPCPDRPLLPTTDDLYFSPPVIDDHLPLVSLG